MISSALGFGAPESVPRRERGAQQVERGDLGAQLAGHLGDEMRDVGEPLRLEEALDLDRSGDAHAREVVAAEVDEHDVLRPLLRVALELLGEDAVLAVVGAPWPRARDRVRREAVTLDPQEELRAGTDDLERGRPDEEQVRTRVDAPE